MMGVTGIEPAVLGYKAFRREPATPIVGFFNIFLDLETFIYLKYLNKS